MVVTAISVAFGHARTASISRPMPCASFPWVYTSLATWCTAPISRTILAVEAIRLVKKDHLGARASRPHKDHLGARASRPHKPRHDGRDPRKGGFGAPCKGVAVDGRLFAGIRCGRDARAPRWARGVGCGRDARAPRGARGVGCGRDARAPGWAGRAVEAAPYRFVALRRSWWPFVDKSFTPVAVLRGSLRGPWWINPRRGSAPF